MDEESNSYLDETGRAVNDRNALQVDPAVKLLKSADRNEQETEPIIGTQASSDTVESDESTSSPSNSSLAPVLSVDEDFSEVDPKNVMRSPPKLLPAVPLSEVHREESSKSTFKPLTGSMKNTPASLSIIDVPVSLSGKSTRSTRSSIDPTFAAKQRSFLNKVHSALSSTRIEDRSTGDSDMVLEYVSDGESLDYTRASGGNPSKRYGLNGLKRRREDSCPLKEKDTSDCNADTSSLPGVSEDSDISPSSVKKSCIIIDVNKNDSKLLDSFCWYCHRDDSSITPCASCPRVFHNRCLKRPAVQSASAPMGEWVCPECVTILKAENSETRSKALRMLSLDQLCNLLQFAVDRMKSCPGAEVFDPPVDLNQFPSYKDFIVNPMHLSLLEKNIKRRMYGSTEAFVADAAWIVHNCIIFNTYQSKLTSVAKNIMRICRQEMSEIENCPDCYKHAYTCEDNWFIRVCRKPHLLVWAKLKGFPFWPAKAMRVNTEGAVDVRFFGAHDRSWVPARDCFLYSQENPNNSASNKQSQQLQSKKRIQKHNLDTCIEEVELHIQQLRLAFADFNYAPLRTPLNPKKMNDQLNFLLPQFAVKNDDMSPQCKTLQEECATKQPDKTSVEKVPLITPKDVNNDNNTFLKQEKIHNFGKTDTIKENNTHPTVVQAVQKTYGAGGKSDKKRNAENTTDSSTVMKKACTSVVNIAEQRLKKKDIRKIGLVDRLHEKLSQWLMSSPVPETVKGRGNSDCKVTLPEKGLVEEDRFNKEMSEKSDVECQNSVEVSVSIEPENACSNGALANQKLLEVELTSDEQDERKQLEKHLLMYKMSKCQPKVMLKKLFLPSVIGNNTEVVTSVNQSTKSEVQDDKSKVECVLVDSNSEHGSCTKLVLQQVVENVPDKKETKDSRTDCSVMRMGGLSSLEQNRTHTAQKIQDNVINKESSLGSSEKTQDTLKESTKCLLRVLSPCALGIKPTSTTTLNKHHQDEDSLKNDPNFSSSYIKTLIPVHPSVSISANKTSAHSQNNDGKMSTPEKCTPNNNLGPTLCKNSTPESDFTEKNVSELASRRNLMVDEKPQTPTSTMSSSVVEAPALPCGTFHIKSGLRINDISRPIRPEAQKVLNHISPLVHAKSNNDDVGNIEISTQTSSITQPATSSQPSIVSHSIALSGSKRPAVVTVSTSSAGVPVVRRLLPKAITLSPSSLLVAPSTSSMSRINIGPLQSSAVPVHNFNTNVATSSSPQFNKPTVLQAVGLVSTASVISKEKSQNNHQLEILGTKHQLQPRCKTLGSQESSTLPTSNCNQIKKISSSSQVSSDGSEQPSESLQSPGLASGHLQNHITKTSTHSSEQLCNPKEHQSPSPIQKSPKSQGVDERSIEPLDLLQHVQSIGPASSTLRSQAVKLSDMFMNCMQEYLQEVGSVGNLEAQVRCLQLDLEHMHWRHKQEMDELRHNTELLISEIRDSLKVEAQRAVTEAMKIARAEKEAAIAATKRKQWCAFCGKEALFYCCWNTSYCDYKCQKNHWPAHTFECMQDGNSSDERLSGKVEGRPKF